MDILKLISFKCYSIITNVCQFVYPYEIQNPLNTSKSIIIMNEKHASFILQLHDITSLIIKYQKFK